MNLVPVGLREVKVSKDDADVLVAYSLGSCVGVALWDSKFKVGGMAHVFLPYKLEGGDRQFGKYGETAVPYLVSRLLGIGCRRENLEARIAGGANVIPDLSFPFGDIGLLNVKAVCESLSREKIPISGQDTGGRYGRTMRLYIDSGKVTISSTHHNEIKI